MNPTYLILYRYLKSANLSLFSSSKDQIHSLLKKIQNDYTQGLLKKEDFASIYSQLSTLSADQNKHPVINT